MIIQAILPSIAFKGIKASDPNSNGLGWVFIIFGFVMALGAVFAWGWIPDLQNIRDLEGGFKLPSKTLELLGKGLCKTKGDGQGMRNKFYKLVKPFLQWWKQLGEADSVNDGV